MLVDKLGIKTTKHPRPYRLQWLNEGGNIKVTRQALITFSIRRYCDEVLCDIVPMQASHILLGRLWQFDRRVIHDSFINKYSFKMNGRTINLLPMSLKEVYKDQKILSECESAHEKKRCTSKRRVVRKAKIGMRLERMCNEKKFMRVSIQKERIVCKEWQKKR